MSWKYADAIPQGVLRADDTAVRRLETALHIAEASGEDISVANLKFSLGRALIDRAAPGDSRRGVELLAQVRDMCLSGRHFRTHLPLLDFYLARESPRLGDHEDAIPVMRNALDDLFRAGLLLYAGWGTAGLVEALLERGAEGDIAEAQGAIDRCVNLPGDEGGVLRNIWLLRLRALLARARGDEAAYRDFRHRYRAMANSLGFQGHIALADAM